MVCGQLMRKKTPSMMSKWPQLSFFTDYHYPNCLFRLSPPQPLSWPSQLASGPSQRASGPSELDQITSVNVGKCVRVRCSPSFSLSLSLAISLSLYLSLSDEIYRPRCIVLKVYGRRLFLVNLSILDI